MELGQFHSETGSMVGHGEGGTSNGNSSKLIIRAIMGFAILKLVAKLKFFLNLTKEMN